MQLYDQETNRYLKFAKSHYYVRDKDFIVFLLSHRRSISMQFSVKIITGLTRIQADTNLDEGLQFAEGSLANNISTPFCR